MKKRRLNWWDRLCVWRAAVKLDRLSEHDIRGLVQARLALYVDQPAPSPLNLGATLSEWARARRIPDEGLLELLQGELEARRSRA